MGGKQLIGEGLITATDDPHRPGRRTPIMIPNGLW